MQGEEPPQPSAGVCRRKAALLQQADNYIQFGIEDSIVIQIFVGKDEIALIRPTLG